MNLKGMIPFLWILLLCSCKKDETLLLVAQQKEVQKQEAVFAVINANWNFNADPINATVSELTKTWPQWRLFQIELAQHPKTSLGAFQQKAKMISKRAQDLQHSVPLSYDKPEVHSRIATLVTKTNALELYMNLQPIPETKIIALVPEINKEWHALQTRLGEIDVKSRIKMEEGEEDMIRMLDTSRAIQVNEAPQLPANPTMSAKKQLLLTPKK